MRLRRSVLLVPLVGMLVAAPFGCSDDGDEVKLERITPRSTTPGQVSTTGSTNPAVSPYAVGPNLENRGPSGSGCTPGDTSDLPDGWWAGSITAIAGTTIDFDLVCWFNGDAAHAAAAEDGQGGDHVHNVYIRNNNPRTFSQTFPSESAPATLADASGVGEPYFTASIGDVLEVYRRFLSGTRTTTVAGHQVEAYDVIWMHVTNGVPDYVSMLPLS